MTEGGGCLGGGTTSEAIRTLVTGTGRFQHGVTAISGRGYRVVRMRIKLTFVVVALCVVVVCFIRRACCRRGAALGGLCGPFVQQVLLVVLQMYLE